MLRRPLALCVSLVALATSACTKSAPPPEVTPPRIRAADYQPLAIGNAWSYAGKMMNQPVERTITIIGVQNRFFVDDANGKLRVDAEGLRDDRRYLLKDPIQKGNRWKSIVSVSSTEHYEILDTGFNAQTPAGHFQDCVLVRGVNRIDREREMSTEWTFAPGVGIVRIATSVKVGDKDIPQGLIELKSFKLVTEPPTTPAAP